MKLKKTNELYNNQMNELEKLKQEGKQLCGSCGSILIPLDIVEHGGLKAYGEKKSDERMARLKRAKKEFPELIFN